MKKIWLMFILVFQCHLKLLAQLQGNAQFVNPFIGAADNGHTFPGATVPFGLVQASPETGNASWDYCSGYRYEDKKIWGFAQTHLNGTGIPDLGDILLQPFSGSASRDNFQSSFDKSTEKASPGYYTVVLKDFNIKAELTATAHTAFHQYTYSNLSGPASLLVDLQSGLVSSEKQLREHVLESEQSFEGTNTITGYSKVRQWVERNLYYVIVFNRPIIGKKELPRLPGEKAPRYVLDFNLKAGEKLLVKIAISTVSVDGARKNLKDESTGWSFDAVRNQAWQTWNQYLSKVHVKGNLNQKVNFYTSLYHLFIQPNNIADVDGHYRGPDNKVYQSKSKSYYSTFSLWDTYRAAHPLYTILIPEKAGEFINSMLQHTDKQGYLPIWTLWGKENFCMIGNHAVPVIADAYSKKLKGFDAQRAFQAIDKSLTTEHPKSQWGIYDQYGYLPFDLVKEESVSRTLEQAFDDYAAAMMAKGVGNQSRYLFYKNRAESYKRVFDTQTSLMRGKDSNRHWRQPFNVFHLSHAGDAGGDYTEGNAWQYTWSVQHDVPGLIQLMGGKVKTAQKLDSLFTLPSTKEGNGFTGDVTGLIGQYAHGNEPSHHVAYMYTLLGKPHRTQELVREICSKFYMNKSDGLSGNDDCGQMSAWYIFTAMGFYPVNPIGGEFVLGAPQLPEIRMEVGKGKFFIIQAKNLSNRKKYVKQVLLNGKHYLPSTIQYQQLMSGGRLIFEMM
ncbi:GH92 family glycosyl hydrolase [Mucilaginibacter sp. PAMB04274]|uniref:GH92 family glycosyl hydrolase n=1 Tax=Mucilaginibacter sp. PAMB04274 TaxID=3138568 RepID=UPI0031F60EB0